MNILISNDDGVFKYGLKVLANALASMEDVNVYVVGPSQNRSCAGHGLFLHDDIIVEEYSKEGFDRVEGVWSCSGTPADCVKTGVSIARYKGIPIDMVWDLMDVFMAIMGILNITALFLLFRYVIPVFKDYFKQKKEGVEEPVFVLENVDFEGLDTSGITSWSGKE